MAIKITEDGAVRYVNENDVDRTMFPNLTGAMGDEQYDALNGRLTVVEGKVSDLEECCGDVNTDIGQIKNDLSEKADKTDALSAYIVETETGAIASFSDGADNVPVKDLQVAIEPVQSGSGDPSPTNIRPISGWTGAKVTRTGKNIVDFTVFSRNGITATKTNGIAHISGTATALAFPVNLVTVTLPAGTYVWSIPTLPSGVRAEYLKNGSWAGAISNGTLFTISEDTTISCYIRINEGSTVNFDAYIQLEVGSTASTYEPYQGETYEVDWTTEAGTVYGGTLDVTTGVLTVDTARIALSSLNFDVVNTHYFYSGITGITYNSLQIWSDTYKTTAPYNGYNESNFDNCTIAISQSQARIAIRDDSYSDVASFVASLTDKYIVYGLSEPQTYQLTPQEVKTVLGQNNIFADCGSVNVQYRADTKLYIDKVLSA